MGADSCPAVCRFGACGGHVPTLCLRCTRSFVSVAFLLVPLPPSAFFLIHYLVIYSFRGWFILLPLGFWPQCDRCYSGGPGRGGSWLGCGLVGLWVFFHLGVYCGCRPVAHGHPTSTCDAGVNDDISSRHHD